MFYTMKDFNFENKKVLVRVDYNVPLDENGNVKNDKRIRSSLPTIKQLIEQNAKIIIMTSVGRPKGKIIDNLRTKGIAEALSKLIDLPVKSVDECIGIEDEVDKLKPSQLIMLENLRFHPEEEQNDADFARKLASLGEIYINDAFANCHRAHASMHAITQFLPSCAGLLVENEVNTIKNVLENAEKPFVVLIGGAKLETKIPVIRSLLKKADKILVGGAMIFNFYKAQGLEIGNSKYEPDITEFAKELLEEAKEKIVLPVDVVVANEISENALVQTVGIGSIEKNELGLDIGNETINLFCKELETAQTIIWNGPMGVFEIETFAKGTNEIAKRIASMAAVKIVGGGDSVAAIEKLGLEDKFTLVSTGGGATLELIEKGTLKALEALELAYNRML